MGFIYARQAVTGWRNLTEEQRRAWDEYADRIELPQVEVISKSVSGFNWYVACTVKELYLSMPIEDWPPTTKIPGPVKGFAIEQNASLPKIDISWGTTQGAEWVELQLTIAVIPSRKIFYNVYRVWEFEPSALGAAITPSLTYGKKYGVKARLVRDCGQYGRFQELQIILVAP